MTTAAAKAAFGSSGCASPPNPRTIPGMFDRPLSPPMVAAPASSLNVWVTDQSRNVNV